MGAAQEAEELVETAFCGPEFIFETQVPFADHAGRVAEFLQALGQCRFGERQPEIIRGLVLRPGIVLEAEALLVAAGHEPGPRRGAQRAGYIALREADAVAADRVHVRRGNIFAALNAEIVIAEIVDQDQNDVRLCGLSSMCQSFYAPYDFISREKCPGCALAGCCQEIAAFHVISSLHSSYILAELRRRQRNSLRSLRSGRDIPDSLEMTKSGGRM